MAACSLGKNIQNEEGTVIHGQTKLALQIALLTRAQTLVKQDFLGTGLNREKFDLFDFARPYEQRSIGSFAFAGQSSDWKETR